MSLGTALLNPQVLARIEGLNDTQAFGDDLLAVGYRILSSPQCMQDVGPLFSRAFERMGERFAARLESRLQQALAGAQALLTPVTRQADQLAKDSAGVRSPLDALALVETLLDAALGAVQNLSEAALRDLVRQIHALATGSLGLSQDALGSELAQVLADVRAGLLEGTAALDPQTAATRYALVAVLGRIEAELLPQLPRFDLSPDRMAQIIYTAFARTGLGRLRTELACLVDKLKAALGAVRGLANVAAGQPFGAHSVGAGEAHPAASGDQYCWYASWLYSSQNRGGGVTALAIVNQLVGTLLGTPDGFPKNEVWLSADRTQLILRRPLQDDQVLHTFEGGNGRWQDAPQFASTGPASYTFGPFNAEFMEFWAQLSVALGTFVKSILHTVALATSPKEYAANTPLAVWNLAHSVGASLGGAPLLSIITREAGWGVGSQWLYTLAPWLAVGIGSIEGKHTAATSENCRAQWATLFAGDVLSTLGVNVLPGGVANAILSAMTLLNQKGPGSAPDGVDTRPRNREHLDPLVSAAVAVTLKLAFFPLIPREDYCYPSFGTNPKFFLYWLLSVLMASGTGMLATLLSWGLARTVEPKQLGLQAGWAALQAALSFPIQYYQELEGDTDDGKYNPGHDSDGKPLAVASPPFTGYPKPDTSPYRLPWERGVPLYVSQANQGMFSHMRLNPASQIYAYDFAHDYGQEVLAARPGTVVDFYDWVDDNTEPGSAEQAAIRTQSNAVMGATWRADNPGWNFIIVRHDTVVPVHDTEVLDASIRALYPCTYAVYGHGKQGSIRAAFAARGVTDPTLIIGTEVLQGQVLMGADDTGFSFHSHVHMHVRGGPAKPATPPPSPVAPIADGVLSVFTFPFVFREIRSGVPKSLTWYTSDNERAG